MSKSTTMTLAILLFLGGLRTLPPRQSRKADLAVTNGKIFTANDAAPWAEAVAVTGGRIVAVGTDREIERFIGRGTKVIDVAGKLVIPGLIDAHTHFASGGRSLIGLSFRGVTSIAKVQEMIAAKIKELPAGALVSGSDYDHTLFPGGAWPTKEDLDKVSPSNPVVIERVDGHCIWVNSLALERAGITKDTGDPFGGEILKDPTTGEPTGILTEAAVGLVRIPGPEIASTPEQDIVRALEHAAGLGLTGVHTDSSFAETAALQEARRRGQADPARLCLAARGVDDGFVSATASARGRATTWSASAS